MSAEPRTGSRCANEECGRLREPGERYCPTCGLERSLFDPEARRHAAERRAGQTETDGR